MAEIKFIKGGTEEDCGTFYFLHIDGSYMTTIYRAHWNPKKWAIYYDRKTTLEGNTRLEVAKAYVEHHEKMVAAMPKPQPTTLEVLLEMVKDAVAEHEKAEQLKADFWSYGINSLDEALLDDKNSSLQSALACPVTYLEEGYTGLTYACLPHELSYEADEKWKAYQPKDFESAFKPSEHVCHDTDSYWISNSIPFDRENQDKIALNFYSRSSSSEKVHLSYSTALYGNEWCEEVAGSDMVHDYWKRLAIGFCCSIPVSKFSTYRCTRNDAYSSSDLIGHLDESARQGYYIEAFSVQDAKRRMREQFPEDKLGFTAKKWS